MFFRQAAYSKFWFQSTSPSTYCHKIGGRCIVGRSDDTACNFIAAQQQNTGSQKLIRFLAGSNGSFLAVIRLTFQNTFGLIFKAELRPKREIQFILLLPLSSLIIVNATHHFLSNVPLDHYLHKEYMGSGYLSFIEYNSALY